MIIKILGILDIAIGVIFWLFGIFNIIPNSFILLLGFILFVKGIIFITGLSIISVLDIIFGIIMITATEIVMPKLIIILISIFLIQKGIFSLLN